jgi:hypothetical protein
MTGLRSGRHHDHASSISRDCLELSAEPLSQQAGAFTKTAAYSAGVEACWLDLREDVNLKTAVMLVRPRVSGVNDVVLARDTDYRWRQIDEIAEGV